MENRLGFMCCRAALLTLLCAFVIVPVQAATGVEWLGTQAHIDGSVSAPTDLASVVQATAEIHRTLAELGRTTHPA